MEKIQNIYKVLANERLSQQYWRLVFDAPDLSREVKPGQFVHIRTDERGLQPFFRRPFSVYRAQKYVEIFYDVIGPGTRLLMSKKKGDTLDVLGPLGTPFVMPPAETRQVVMVAGGIGIAPMLILSDVLKMKKYELLLLYGGRDRGHVYPMKEFKDNGVKVHIATDDGSVGAKGRVSVLFDKIDKGPSPVFIYTCGPNPMMKAVQAFASEKGLAGQAACEEIMACGLGACLGCSIETAGGFKTVCYDGPCFDLDEVKFH
ncbi:MAG: dihydroorotate dehydrogenase electron transfer subunit [Candidatus Omnitrophica bacterium]|nr:dihydroorotate dehydrogenase electron transfer subunit [Candidatus Omnitrophota bacterium]MDE2221741.1 dihydroorotate dehydrogenase electron transfer subunit [Candidatus Omnitrophota bacterium]